MEWSFKYMFIWGSVLLSLRITHQTGNVAPRGIAILSENSPSGVSPPDPYLALDENLMPSTFEETCTSLPQQDDPWWQVDLMSIYHITAVSVVSIGDCCPEQLNGAEIRIGLKNDTSNHRCGIITVVAGQRSYKFQCEIKAGRFVHVILPGQAKTLTVCEVQVYGTILENVALRGVAFQSSLRWKTAGKASSVIDGNRISTCSITKNEPSQWVKVDLLAPYNVTLIQLSFSENSYGDEVWVDDTRCWVLSSSSNSLVTLDCGGIVGRYVTVKHPDIPLDLCELEVYSTWEHPENTFPQRPLPHSYCLDASCSRDLIFIRDEPKTWFESQTYCRERYTDQATIKDARDMNKFIDNMDNNDNDIWIGLYEDVLSWKWSLSDEGYYEDGEAEFRNWDAGEPNSGSGIQHCVGMQHTGEWKALDCGLLNFFFCFDGRDDASESKILVETPMAWASAQYYCRQRHTDLLSVRNLDENQEIQVMVPQGKLVWIGLFGDSWKWSDGSSYVFRSWGQGQPDSLGEGPNCAHVHDKTWSIKSCDTKSIFLCYYYKKKYSVKITTDSDTRDPAIQQQITKHLEAEIKNKGISDIKIRWRVSGVPIPPEEVKIEQSECRDGGEI